MCTKINPCAMDVGFSELARSLLCEVSCLSLSGIPVRPREVPEVFRIAQFCRIGAAYATVCLSRMFSGFKYPGTIGGGSASCG